MNKFLLAWFLLCILLIASCSPQYREYAADAPVYDVIDGKLVQRMPVCTCGKH